ncbi:unnamed protein product, partial [Allacma fusca]
RSMKASNNPVANKTTRPYIEEGGIFSRKNLNEGDNEEAAVDDMGSVGTSASSGNLWNYVNTAVFGGLIGPKDGNSEGGE